MRRNDCQPNRNGREQLLNLSAFGWLTSGLTCPELDRAFEIHDPLYHFAVRYA